MKTVALGDLVDIKGGGTPSKDVEAYWGGDVPWASVKDFKTSEIATTIDSLTPEGVANSATNVIPANSILVPTRMAVGKAAINTIPMAINQDLKALTPRKGVDLRYLLHALLAKAPELEKQATGATVKGITLPVLKSLKIPLPPLEEQKRISAILDQADELRRKRQRAVDRLGQLGQAIFIEMFGDPVANPFGFPVRKLGELGDLDRGISKHRPRNDPALLNGDHPLIQTGDVANADGYIRHFSSTYSDLGLRQSRKWPVGTLCITIAANIGKTAILEIEACFPDSVVGFTPSSSTNAEYVQHWMERIQKRLEEVAPQSAQKNINLAILRELPVPVPLIEKQSAFSSRMKAIEAQKLKLKIAAGQCGQLFSSLQHRAFRGELTASSLREAAA